VLIMSANASQSSAQSAKSAFEAAAVQWPLRLLDTIRAANAARGAPRTMVRVESDE
jgi:hypothetical protein